MSATELAQRAVELALEKKGHQIVKMDISKLTNISDYFVVISGDSNIQIKAIADYIEDGLRNEGVHLYHKEGYQSLSWVLLDYVDVVIHIFNNESRAYYGIERLWGDAKIELVTETVK